MKTATEIQAALAHYYGTENYHRYSALFHNHLLTDGAKALADMCQAYWLIDVICSHHAQTKGEGFQVWKLTKEDSKATVTCGDGNGNELAKQDIPYTDFPLDEITLYCIEQGDNWIILLTSEY